jgi:ABC-type Na+ transport system ATPase subunit NatA
MTAKAVSEYSHGMAWKLAELNELIPYEAVFISDDPVTNEDVAHARELAARYGWKF